MWHAFFFRASLRRQNAALLMCSQEESGFQTLGGIDQWVGIRGERPELPALLILHGGPGSPYSIFSPQLRQWEKHFNVVQWDQRGAGKTYGKNGCGELTFERLTADGLELAAELHRRFGRVVLLGSSVGSIIGLRMALQRPDLFVAYVGADQNVGGGERMERKHLEREMRRRIDAMVGVPHMVKDVIAPAMLTSPTHSWRDIRDIAKGMTASLDRLFDALMAFDAFALGTRFALPFVIVQGEADLITPVSGARHYFDAIDAPRKRFVTVANCGHLVAMTRPAQVLEVLLSCLP